MAEEVLSLKINESGARIVKRNIDGIATSSKNADGSIGLLRRSLGFLGGALILKNAIDTLRRFDQEMSTVKAITGATEVQFRSLTQTAKDLGIRTRFSATQAAEGMSFLARAGFTTEQVLSSINDTLVLAQSGALDLGSAADIASNVLTGFRLKAEETGRVVDVLSKAANTSNTNVLQLGEGMKFAAPIAAGLGVEIEETAAAIGVLSNAGLQASLAGTGLRTALLLLESPTSSGENALKKYGLSLDDVSIKQNGLVNVLETLSKTAFDVTDAVEVAGTRGGPALDILVQSARNGDKTFRDFADSFRGIEGFAQNVADVMDDNLNGALLAVKSAAEGLVLSFNDLGANNILTEFFRGLAKFIRLLAANVDILAKSFVVLSSVLLVTFARTALVAAISGLKVLRLAVLANPIGILVTALVGGSVALVAFSDDLKVTKTGIATLTDLFQSFKDTFSAGFESLKKSVGGFGRSISSELGVAFDSVDLSFAGVLRTTSFVLDTILSTFLAFGRAIGAGLASIPSAIKDIFLSTINGAISIVESGINSVVKALNKLPKVNIDEVILKRVNNSSEGALERFGSNVSEAFKSGLNQTAFQDSLTNALVKAEDIAIKRKIETNKKLKDLDADRLKEGANRSSLQDNSELTGPVAVDSDFDKLIKDLKARNELLKLGIEDRKSGLAILELERDLEIQLTAEQRNSVLGLQKANEQLQIRADVLDSVRQPQIDFRDMLKSTNDLLKDSQISLQENNALITTQVTQAFQSSITALDNFVLAYQETLKTINDLRQKDLITESQAQLAKAKLQKQVNDIRLGYASDFFSNLASLSQSENKKLAAIGRAAAITEATISGIQAVQNALAVKPYYLGVALAVGAGAAAAANISKIASARAIGGTVSGAELFRVGEASFGRPELFTGNSGQQFFIPPERGRIDPISQINRPEKQQVAPNIQVSAPAVKVVVVKNENEIKDFIDSPDSDAVFIQKFQKNAGSLQDIVRRG